MPRTPAAPAQSEKPTRPRNSPRTKAKDEKAKAKAKPKAKAGPGGNVAKLMMGLIREKQAMYVFFGVSMLRDRKQLMQEM